MFICTALISHVTFLDLLHSFTHLEGHAPYQLFDISVSASLILLAHQQSSPSAYYASLTNYDRIIFATHRA